jgi:trimeric autotransporter adhesin
MIPLEELMTWFGRVAFRRVARLLPLIPMIVLCASCSDFWVSNSSTGSITVTPTALILKAATATVAGDSSQISASATTVGGTTTDETSAATWTSSNNSAVTVTAGKVTVVGLTAGLTSVITATFGGQSATTKVLTYTGTAPTALNAIGGIPANSGQLTPGQTFQLTASANISGSATQDVSSFVTWVSSNTTAATVSSTGLVTVLGNVTTGAAFTITATANFAGASVSSPGASFIV